MKEINEINTGGNNLNHYRQQLLNNIIKNEEKNNNGSNKKDKVLTKKGKILDKITYGNPKAKEDQNIPSTSAIQRPLHIDKSNNIFYINYKNENKTIKIKPGEYNLIELRQAIQDKVNESFGIGEVKLDLTASGSDRLIRAKDSKIFDLVID